MYNNHSELRKFNLGYFLASKCCLLLFLFLFVSDVLYFLYTVNRQSALFKTCIITPWAGRCHTSRQWCRGCRCTCRGGRAARGQDSHWSSHPQPPGERERTFHKRNICSRTVCAPPARLPQMTGRRTSWSGWQSWSGPTRCSPGWLSRCRWPPLSHPGNKREIEQTF